MIIMEFIDVTREVAVRWDSWGCYENPSCIPSIGQHVYRSKLYTVTDVIWNLPVPASPPAKPGTTILVVVKVTERTKQ